jgi:2-octaprenyl-6-methoxyphenol hydroxylase
MPAAATDILVRGAGPVGCVAALALQDFHEVRVLEREGPAPGFRPIVLSYASRLILERVGAWRGLAPTPIEAIRVSQAGAFGRTVLEAADAGVPALGYVLEYGALLEGLRAAARHLLVREDCAARLVVHAEGAAAQAAEKRYAQDALVASVRFADAPAATAFERFTAAGPLALLPLRGRTAVVWSMAPGQAQERVSMSEGAFLGELAAAAGTRPGRPVAVESRAVQPLFLRVTASRVAERSLSIGNAAQTLHPVAGQGLNLGLRDAWDLAQVLRDAQDPGDAAVLARFAAQRRMDAGAAIRVTDLLATALLRSNPLTGAALTALDIFPAARRFFARRMIFGPSAAP